MSRAFVKEDDADGSIDTLPDRPISPYPNIDTPEGLTAIEGQHAELAERHAAASRAWDRATQAASARELRYWNRGERARV